MRQNISNDRYKILTDNNFLNSQNTLADLKGPKRKNKICTLDDLRGDILGPPHGTTPAAVIANKIKLRSFKSSEHIYEKGDGPYRGFVYLSLFSDPTDLATCFCNFETFNRVVDTKTSIM